MVGVLTVTNPVHGKLYWDAFTDELRKYGWEEGKNLTIKYLSANGDVKRLDELAREFVTLKSDVLCATLTESVLALQRATREIPIVFMGISDPVKSGVAKSLRKPGGNATGPTGNPGEEVVGKRLEILKECLPRLSTLAVFTDPRDSDNERFVSIIKRYAAQLGIHVVPMNIAGASDIGAVFDGLSMNPPDALYVLYSAAAVQHRELIAARARDARLPTIAGQLPIAEAGLLLGHAPDPLELVRLSARYVDKILRGAKPGDLPIEQPTRMNLLVNLRTAKAIGVTVPQSILLRADRVIE